MTRFLVSILLIGYLFIAPTGCSKTAPVPEAAKLKEIDTSLPDQAIATDVSKEQAEEFASQMQLTISEGDADSASNLILLDRMLDRLVLKLGASKKIEAELRKGLAKKNPLTPTFEQIASSIPQGGSYKLVRTAVRGDEMHAIFRMIDSEKRLNYHDFRLVIDHGKVKADQLFLAATGESFTDSLINVIGPAVRAQQSSISRMTGEATQKAKDLEKQSQMTIAAREGNAKKALAIYETLPQKIKESKLIQLSRVMVSQTQSEEKYIAAMTDYANLFPNDPSVALMSFDKAVMNEDLVALKKCMATLNTWTGGDDYLRLMAATLVARWGNTDYAKELYQNADTLKLGIADAHYFKMSAALECDDYPVIAEELRIQRDEYGTEFDLDSDPVFAKFWKSPEAVAFKSK